MTIRLTILEPVPESAVPVTTFGTPDRHASPRRTAADGEVNRARIPEGTRPAYIDWNNVPVRNPNQLVAFSELAEKIADTMRWTVPAGMALPIRCENAPHFFRTRLEKRLGIAGLKVQVVRLPDEKGWAVIWL